MDFGSAQNDRRKTTNRSRGRQFIGVGLGSIKSCPKCMLGIRSEDKRFVLFESSYVLYLHSEQTNGSKVMHPPSSQVAECHGGNWTGSR